MAVSTNLLLSALSGTIAGQVTIKNYGDKVVVSKKIGKRTKKTTKKQANNEGRFALANEMASERYADLAHREEVRLRLKLQSGQALYRAIVKECIAELKAAQQ